MDDEFTTEECEALHETVEALGASTKLVCLFFTAALENGVHVIHWGNAHLEPNRTFTWFHSEQLWVAPQPLE
ncbi:hypothetical protein ABZV65_00465 [Streptomyces bauhiniae]|uniref:hypothetical protein n=1 Tax=Streptomyces bauhiniae TaxID=2340725 RepID=UPI00339F1D4B